MLSNPKVVELAKKIEAINPKIKKMRLTEVAIQRFLIFNKILVYGKAKRNNYFFCTILLSSSLL